jgi:hypothetical protein
MTAGFVVAVGVSICASSIDTKVEFTTLLESRGFSFEEFSS